MDILDIVGQFWMANRFGVGWICAYIWCLQRCVFMHLIAWPYRWNSMRVCFYVYLRCFSPNRKRRQHIGHFKYWRASLCRRNPVIVTDVVAAWPYILEFIVFSENVRRVLRVINEVKLYTKLYTIKIYYTGTMGNVRLQSRHRIAYSSFQSECWAESKNVLLISTEWAEIN